MYLVMCYENHYSQLTSVREHLQTDFGTLIAYRHGDFKLGLPPAPSLMLHYKSTIEAYNIRTLLERKLNTSFYPFIQCHCRIKKAIFLLISSDLLDSLIIIFYCIFSYLFIKFMNLELLHPCRNDAFY